MWIDLQNYMNQVTFLELKMNLKSACMNRFIRTIESSHISIFEIGFAKLNSWLNSKECLTQVIFLELNFFENQFDMTRFTLMHDSIHVEKNAWFVLDIFLLDSKMLTLVKITFYAWKFYFLPSVSAIRR